jgi:adenylate cyclase
MLRFSGFKLGLLLTMGFCLLKLMYSVEALKSSELAQFLENIESSVLDLKFKIRGGPKDPAERKRFQEKSHVVIVAVDERSTRMKDLGLWPWPRAKIAAIIDQLHRCEARVIGFDMVFSEKDAARITPVVQSIQECYDKMNPGGDRFSDFLKQTYADVNGDAQLARVLESSDNVVLGYFFFASPEEIQGLAEDDIATGIETISFGSIGYLAMAEGLDQSRVFPKAYGVRANLPKFTDAVELFGFFNQLPDQDRIYRRVPLLYAFTPSQAGRDAQVNVFPSLSLQVLSSYYKQPINLFVDLLPDKSTLLDYTGLFIGPLGPPDERHIEIPLETTKNNRGRFRVNFYGPKQTFRHVSAGDIIHHDQAACDAVRDKIVLVGATTMAIYDLRPTPFDHSFPGVEIHATVIENVIGQDFLIRPHGFGMLEAAFMLFLGILFGWFLTRFKLNTGLVVTLLSMVALALVDYFWLFSNGTWAHIVLLDLQLFFTFAGIAVYRYATEERKKRETRRAFQFYLSKDVIDTILNDNTKLTLGGERRELTVLFTDIRGFTTISEGLAPEELTVLLNEYLTPMTELVFKYKGTLDKYMGDAIMAFYGAPIPFEDHPQAACRTALEMMTELEKLRQGWRTRGLPELDIGIGVNTGSMSVGNMGSENRFDYTVMGDHVNLGSRLEGLNKQYDTHIIISGFTQKAVGEHFTCRELDSVAVKGKKEPVRIFELLHAGPPEPDDAWIEDFQKGLYAYRAQRWKDALEHFETLVRTRQDKASRIYIERSQKMQANPPDPNWDGVFKMKTK